MGAYKAMYDVLRKTDLEQWKKAKPEELAKNLKKVFPKMKGDSADGTLCILAAKVAHATTEPEFEEFMASGETPPMKLSNDEMKVLQGGNRLVIPAEQWKNMSPEQRQDVQDSLGGGFGRMTDEGFQIGRRGQGAKRTDKREQQLENRLEKMGVTVDIVEMNGKKKVS